VFLRRGLDRNCKVVEVAAVALEQPPDSGERSGGFSPELVVESACRSDLAIFAEVLSAGAAAAAR